MAELHEWTKYVSDWRKSKGFYTPPSIDPKIHCPLSEADATLGKLFLVVCELAEAGEAVRHNNLENFTEELADTIIRIFDIAGTQGIDLEAAVSAKMKINEERPIRHGKHTQL